jgi:predicted nucleic acid-binding protein
MRVVDTSAWIEALVQSSVGQKVLTLLPPESDWLVPTIVQYELAKWGARLPAEQEEAIDVIAFSRLCVVVPLTTPIALEASDLGREFRLAAADAIVYATARHFGADLLTCDGHFDGLPDVRYLPKAPH